MTENTENNEALEGQAPAEQPASEEVTSEAPEAAEVASEAPQVAEVTSEAPEVAEVKSEAPKTASAPAATGTATTERRPAPTGGRDSGSRSGGRDYSSRSGGRDYGGRSGGRDGGRSGGGGRGGYQRGGPRQRFRPRRSVCSFCVDKVTDINYKETGSLRRFLDDYGKIRPARKTGTCARHQRRLAVAIKRARHLALLPFTAARHHHD